MCRHPLSLPVKAACLAPEGQGKAQLATGCMLLAQLQLVLAMFSPRSTLASSTGSLVDKVNCQVLHTISHHDYEQLK